MKSLPVDVLKIDKMFVDGVPEDCSMISAIIQLAHSLNLQMIAEGVETEAQREWLSKAGVEVAQGFLFARPVPANIFEERYLAPESADYKVKKGLACASQLKIFNIFVSIMIQHFCHVEWVLL